MPAIVEQLQADAINPNVAVSTLLRKVKLAAVKLKLPKVEVWVDAELNGYDKGKLPDYRIQSGPLRAWDHIGQSWIPVGGDARIMSKITAARVNESVCALETLLAAKGHSTYLWNFSPEQIEALNKMCNYRSSQYGLELTRSQFAEILDRVRNLVLDWALELERQGIMGTEVGFNEQDKKHAMEKGVNIHIGTIGTFTGSLTSTIEGENARQNVDSVDRSKNSARK
jgi:hypothetical protein